EKRQSYPLSESPSLLLDLALFECALVCRPSDRAVIPVDVSGAGKLPHGHQEPLKAAHSGATKWCRANFEASVIEPARLQPPLPCTPLHRPLFTVDAAGVETGVLQGPLLGSDSGAAPRAVVRQVGLLAVLLLEGLALVRGTHAPHGIHGKVPCLLPCADCLSGRATIACDAVDL